MIKIYDMASAANQLDHGIYGMSEEVLKEILYDVFTIDKAFIQSGYCTPESETAFLAVLEDADEFEKFKTYIKSIPRFEFVDIDSMCAEIDETIDGWRKLIYVISDDGSGFTIYYKL